MFALITWQDRRINFGLLWNSFRILKFRFIVRLLKSNSIVSRKETHENYWAKEYLITDGVIRRLFWNTVYFEVLMVLFVRVFTIAYCWWLVLFIARRTKPNVCFSLKIMIISLLWNTSLKEIFLPRTFAFQWREVAGADDKHFCFHRRAQAPEERHHPQSRFDQTKKIVRNQLLFSEFNLFQSYQFFCRVVSFCLMQLW